MDISQIAMEMGRNINRHFGTYLNTYLSNLCSLFCIPLRKKKHLHLQMQTAITLMALSYAPISNAATALSCIYPADDSAYDSSQHYTIKEILLERQPIFDSSNPEENKRLHRLANRLHIDTQNQTILRVLPLKVGDPFHKRDRAVAERALNRAPYLSEVDIEVSEICNGAATLTVKFREVWSIIPSASYSHIDNENAITLQITDVNLFGLGQTLAIGYSEKENQGSIQGSYFAPFLINNNLDLSVSIADGDHFSTQSMQLQKPFRNLFTLDSYGIESSRWETTRSHYLRSTVLFQYDQRVERLNLFYGISKGLSDGWVGRHKIGISKSNDIFENYEEQLPMQDRKRRSLWYSFHRFENSFKKLRNIHHMHRTENIFYGKSLHYRVGYADDTENSETDYLEIATTFRWSPLLSNRHFINTEFSTRGSLATDRDSDDGISSKENIISQMRLSYFWLHNKKQRTVILADRTSGRSLTLDRLLTQGGDQNLRGYPQFYQMGNEQYKISLEHRYFHDWNILQFIQLASVLYIDAGRAWFSEPSIGNKTQYEGDEMLWNIGIGLRVASNRIGLGNIIHIDVAAPMTDPPILTGSLKGETPDDWRFSFTIKSSF